MTDFFHMGGWGVYPVTVFGGLMVIAALAYALKPERRFVPLQVTLGLMTLSAGVLGTVSGVIRSLLGLHGVEEGRRWIWMLGLGESLTNIVIAFVFVVLALLVASVGALRIALRPAEVR